MPTPSTVYAKAEGEKFKADRQLVVVSCATCHITYAIPESLYRSALAYPGSRSDGWKLCCPVGHTWHYVGLSVDEKLERERDRRASIQADLDRTRASLSAQRGQTTKARNERDRLKTRAAAGVCPCCNRTFQQLARHMKGQHPEFGPTPGADSAF